jgi:tRNA A-37 threonylcarbamoyl transferase component Bud32
LRDAGVMLLPQTHSQSVRVNEQWDVPPFPSAWTRTPAGLWDVLADPAGVPRAGWKVHVSASLRDAPRILSSVALIALHHETTFKFLPTREAFLLLHFKEASRLQSGKFIALYPSSVELAARLLTDLEQLLDGFDGPSVLTDRAIGQSRNVFYRWGAFVGTGRLDDSGKPQELVPDGLGQWIPDLRLPRFSLPEGIADPFATSSVETPRFPISRVALGAYEVTSAVRYNCGGGIYVAEHSETRSEVVIKEARPHTGFVGSLSAQERLEREAEWLRRVNRIRKGLAPQLLDEFVVDRHNYIAIERIPGTPLHHWIAQECPLYTAQHCDRSKVDEYLSRATAILGEIRQILDCLHSAGIAFGDLSPSNIIISSSDRARLVDFEGCADLESRLDAIGTPDFIPLVPGTGLTAQERDNFAFHCLAIAFVLRLTSSAQLSTHALRDVERNLTERVADIPEWWISARAFLDGVARENLGNRRLPRLNMENPKRIRDAIASALLASRTDRDSQSIFPASQASIGGAYLSYASGDSGILSALVNSGYEIPRNTRDRFALLVERKLSSLPLGHSYGLAGVADACDAVGLDDVRDRVLDELENRWPSNTRPELGMGLAGIALTLARFGRTDTASHVIDAALEMGRSHEWTKNGLRSGRSGLAAAASELVHLLPDRVAVVEEIRTLLRHDVDQTQAIGDTSRSMRAEVGGARLLPYIDDGTAGLLIALSCASKVLAIGSVAGNLPSLVSDLSTPFVLEGCLTTGAVGLAVTQDVLRSVFPDLNMVGSDWTRIVKYLVPLGPGVTVLDPRTTRMDLSHDGGSAGILAALSWRGGHAALNIAGLVLQPSA